LCEVFTGQCPPWLEVRHLNGVPNDNRFENLLYGTRSENGKDRLLHGTCHQAIKPDCKYGHALRIPNLVEARLKKGYRGCAACAKAADIIEWRKAKGVGPSDFAEVRRLADELYASIMRDEK
jgi:hypothetical protein